MPSTRDVNKQVRRRCR